MKTLSKIYNGIIFTFLYAPIVVLIVFSFNKGKSRVNWTGFTFDWYKELFHNDLIIESLMLTLKIAVLAAVVSTIIGTLAAVGIYSMNGRLRTLMMGVNNIPMVNPEIVTGISMMLMFVAIGSVIPAFKPGFLTLLLSHITFCIPYVVLQVMPKLRQMNKHMYEAALDLGCRPFPAFFKVVIPEIMPGVITGALMAFIYMTTILMGARFHRTESVGYHLFYDQKAGYPRNQCAVHADVRYGAAASVGGEYPAGSGSEQAERKGISL